MTNEEYAKKELARQKHIIMNSFYGNFGADLGTELFINVNKQSNQENLPDKKLEINDTYKKE